MSEYIVKLNKTLAGRFFRIYFNLKTLKPVIYDFPET